MRVAYFTVFGITAGATALLAILPQLLIMISLLFMVIGPAALAIVGPVMAMPTIALYLAPLLPWAVTGRQPGTSLTLMACGFAAIAAIGGLPGVISQLKFSGLSASYTAGDIAGRRPGTQITRPASVELVRPGLRPRRQAHATERAPCDALCQTILAEGLANEVVITRIAPRPYPTRRAPEPTPTISRMSYRLETRTDCPPGVLPKHPSPLPAAVAQIAAGKCYVASPPGVSQGNLLFRTEDLRTTTNRHRIKRARDSRLTPRSWWLGDVQVRRLEVSDARTRAKNPLHRKTYVRASPIILPTALMPSATFNGYGKNGLFLMRRKAETNPFNFDLEVIHWLGALAAGRWPTQEQPPAPLRRYEKAEQRLANRHRPDNAALVKALLQRPGMQPFNEGADAALAAWVSDIRKQRHVTENDLRIALAVLRDGRFTNLTQFAWLIRRWPEQFTSAIPEILGRLEKPVPERTGHSHGALGNALAKLPLHSLRPYGERIIRIAQAEDRWHMNDLLSVAGQLGIDTTNLFRERLSSSHASTARGAMIGLCRADAPIAAPFMPELLDRFRAAATGNQRLLRNASLLVRTLVRHGRKPDLVIILEATGDHEKRGRVLRRSLRLKAGFAPRFCR